MGRWFCATRNGIQYTHRLQTKLLPNLYACTQGRSAPTPDGREQHFQSSPSAVIPLQVETSNAVLSNSTGRCCQSQSRYLGHYFHLLQWWMMSKVNASSKSSHGEVISRGRHPSRGMMVGTGRLRSPGIARTSVLSLVLGVETQEVIPHFSFEMWMRSKAKGCFQ